MSLKAFHLFFIAVCVLLCLYVGAWGVQEYLEQGVAGPLALALLCFLLGFGLVLYGIRIFSKLRDL